MRRFVVVEIHANHNPKESSYPGHSFLILPASTPLRLSCTSGCGFGAHPLQLAGRRNSGTPITSSRRPSKRVEASGAVHPECCMRRGVFRDLTAAYAAGARWGDALPEPILLKSMDQLY